MRWMSVVRTTGHVSKSYSKRNGWNLSDLGSGMLSDGETEETLKRCTQKVIYVNHTVRLHIKY